MTRRETPISRVSPFSFESEPEGSSHRVEDRRSPSAGSGSLPPSSREARRAEQVRHCLARQDSFFKEIGDRFVDKVRFFYFEKPDGTMGLYSLTSRRHP
jgi:hypothetical protein